MDPTRRKLLKAALLGAGGLGLRGLASSVPAGLLAAPGRAAAQAADTCVTGAQRLILITSSGGDPLNANVPGCYVDGVYHPEAFRTESPWLGLAATAPGLLDRTCFFHHGTYTSAHGDHAKVNSLMGAIRRQEMLVSLIAKNTAACLGTTQVPPVLLSDNLIRFAGAVLPVLDRSALQRVLQAPAASDTTGVAVRARRDADLARLNALFRESGTPAQQAAIDRYDAAQAQARALPADLVTALGDTYDNQHTSGTPDPAAGTFGWGSFQRRRLNTAAVVLFRMNVTPVVVMRWDFGGDNHDDGGLGRERAAHDDSLQALADLWTKLGAVEGLRDTVTIAFQNVFGRTLNAADRGGDTDGRDHNAGHHCSVLIGRGLRPGVVGGITAAGNDFRAQAIRSATGAADENGDVTYEETLAACGKTLCAAAGVSRAVIEDQITSGRVVEAALAPLS